MVNGKCRRHGGKNIWDHEPGRLHLERPAPAPYRPFRGNALDTAIVAYRTQQRLQPLVAELSRRSRFDPDQGVLRAGTPASDACTLPT